MMRVLSGSLDQATGSLNRASALSRWMWVVGLTAMAQTADVDAAPTAVEASSGVPSEGIFLRSVTLDAKGRAFAPLGQTGPRWQGLKIQSKPLALLGPQEVGRFLVRFQGEASEVRTRLEWRSIRIEHWLPVNAFVISGTGEALRSVHQDAARMGLTLMVPYQPEYRIAPELQNIQAEEGELRLLFHLFSDARVSTFKETLQSLGLKPEGSSSGSHQPRVGLRMDARRWLELRGALASDNRVFWIEERGEARLYNTEAVPILQGGRPNAALVLADHGLLGQGQIVGYVDTGLDVDSCFFRDPSGKLPATNVNGGTAVDPTHRKVVAYDFLWTKDSPSNVTQWDNHGHGTHVGGNIGGDNLATPGEFDDEDGMAPLAQFVVQDGGFGTDNCADLPGLGCPVVDLKPIFRQAYVQGARVHTNSWGDNENSSSQNNYSAGSQDVDTVMWENPDYLLLFAAGNSGPTSGSVGSPSTAKNALSIGGTVNGSGYNSLSSFSSRGPTTDNRLKPDLLAPANNTSADSDNNITTNNCGLDTGAGTSYASPLAAGAAALVRQYYMDGYYPTGVADPARALKPSAALVKATLLNSGTSMETVQTFPSFDQGWGRINLDSVLPFPGDTEKLLVVDGTVSFSSSADKAFTYSFSLPDSSVPLKVSLVWTDPAATPAAATSLVNNLDLVVNAPRRVLLGNVFRRGESTTGGTADALNNVEQVLIAAPKAGTYTITVKPTRIVQGPQSFALVIRGPLK